LHAGRESRKDQSLGRVGRGGTRRRAAHRRAGRRYTILVGREGDRPANADRRCGVRWLRWGHQHAAPADPGYGLVIVRNMLAAPGFQHAAQRVTTFGTEDRVMGPYLPQARYTTRRSFAAHGCPH
jgi:hypothetical protein